MAPPKNQSKKKQPKKVKTSPNKATRASYTVAERLQILDLYDELHKASGGKQSFDKLAPVIAARLGKYLARSVLQKTVQKREKWQKLRDSNQDRARQREGKHVQLEQALVIWLNQVRSNSSQG